MAFEKRLVSIKTVIEQAYHQSGIDNIDMAFAMEAAGSLMGIIGIPDVYVNKTTNGEDEPFIEIENFRGIVPSDLIILKAFRRVYLKDNKINSFSEMIEATGFFHKDEDVINQPSQNTNLINKFKIEGNYIFTDFQEGQLEASYLTYPIDDEGLPLIPNDEKFKNALKYDLIYLLDWRRWRKNPAIPGLKAVVNDSETLRDFYVAAARNKARIPSISKMESIKNQWLRSIPKLNEHANSFNTLNNQEVRYTNTRKR